MGRILGIIGAFGVLGSPTGLASATGSTGTGFTMTSGPADGTSFHGGTAAGSSAGSDVSAATHGSMIEAQEKRVYAAQADAPPCHECGEIMIRNGSCYACINCGATSGCS